MARKLGPVFQVRMGNKRIVVANSFDSIKKLWIRNQSTLISRPLLHTFHTVVSIVVEDLLLELFLGDESCQRRRKAAATASNKPAVQSYSAINDIFQECEDGHRDISVTPHIQRFVLNTSLMLNYGIRFNSSSNRFLKEIVEVEGAISRFRSTSNNWQDYVPYEIQRS